jgi:hypothetical protein
LNLQRFSVTTTENITMSSMDKNVGKNIEQQHSEGQGEKRKSGQSNGGSRSNNPELDRVNAELAKPNLTEPARKALLERKKKLGG